MLKGIFKYLFILVLLFIFWSLFLGYYPFLFFFLFFILFIVSLVISLIFTRKTDITIESPHIVERDSPLHIRFLLQCHSIIQPSKVLVYYKIIDNFNNNIISQHVIIYNKVKIQDLVINHSGYYTLVIEKVYYYDLLQCIPIRRKMDISYPFYVFPKLIMVDNYLQRNVGFVNEANEYDIYNKGHDYSEIFEIREYNEFDSLKHIHWKASMKKGDLYVKEGSQPILKKLLLTVEMMSAGDGNDKTLDIFYSLCLSLLEKGMSYEIICPSSKDQKYHIEFINNDIHFKACFQRILRESCYNVDEFIDSIKDYSTLYIIKNQEIEVKKL